MQHAPCFFMPYIIAFSLLFASNSATAMMFSSELPSKKVEWNNVATHAVLQNRNPSQGYIPKIGGNLETVWGSIMPDTAEAKVGIRISIPWIMLVGSCTVDSADKNENGIEQNIIIGDYNRFPAYVQVGILDAIMGRHTSELLSTSSLVTRQLFFTLADADRVNVGLRGGGYYAFNNYSQLKASGFRHYSGQGADVQYDTTYSAIHFLIGGGRTILAHGACLNNIYTEMSGQEGEFNNLVKVKIETIWTQHPAKYALHTEVSYHMPLYYFGAPSAIVVGYAALGETVEYKFGGMKINCFKYFDVVMGMTWGKLNNWNKGLTPLLQLQLSL